MFLKAVNIKGRCYLYMAEAYRENGAVKHRQLLSLGKLETLKSTGQLAHLTRSFNKLSGLYDLGLDDISEQKEQFCYGDVVYRKLWEKYQINQLMKQWHEKNRVRFDIEAIAFLQVIDRLLSPQSRLSLWKNQQRYVNLHHPSLHQLYRCLDVLAQHKEEIEWHIFDRYRHLFNNKVDVVFYDVTTFHFESVCADEMKDFGFSKSGKFNEVQVVLGLLIDEEGHPIGFNLFPGNTSEGKTFLKTLEDLKKRFQINRLIFCADKGLNNHKNLYLLQEAGYEYIVSSRIKSASREIKEQIFNLEGYVFLKEQTEEGEKELYRHKIIKDVKHHFKEDNELKEYRDDLIVTWSEARRVYDEIERRRMVEKASENLEKGISIENKRGWKRYIKTEKTKALGINEEQIQADARWDGYYGIQTNARELSPRRVVEKLHQLWKIEETFRVYKTTLEAEPVFVWTPNRIKGHFVVCFLALVLERALEKRLSNNGVKASPEEIREALNKMIVSKVTIKGKDFYWKGGLNKLAARILGIFKIRQPLIFTPVEEFRIS